MATRHEPVVFTCDSFQLVGIIEHVLKPCDTGVLIITGGPQYRVGSHRQFVKIARELASAGYPTMRFDYRGMGDSDGPAVPFYDVEEDIRAAIDVFVEKSSISRIVIWGLCDAASAAMIYADTDPRVTGMVLVNPWVRTDEGLAKAYVKNYYVSRLFSRAFWSKARAGRLEWRKTLTNLVRNVVTALSFFRKAESESSVHAGSSRSDFRARMCSGLGKFNGGVLFLLCGADLTASEFVDYTKRVRSWRQPMSRKSVKCLELPGLDHTFSNSVWRSQITEETINWISLLSRRSVV